LPLTLLPQCFHTHFPRYCHQGFFDDERFEQHVASVVKDFEAGNYYQDKPYAGSKKEK